MAKKATNLFQNLKRKMGANETKAILVVEKFLMCSASSLDRNWLICIANFFIFVCIKNFELDLRS